MKELSIKQSEELGNYLMNNFYPHNIISLFYSILRTYEDASVLSFNEVIKDMQDCYNESNR